MITTLLQDGLSENQPKKFDIQQLLILKYSNKNLYTLQIKQTETETIQTRKWENTLGKQNLDWKSIFKLSFETTIDNKLRNFNYKYLMGIVRTYKELFKFSLTNSTLCDLCGQSLEDKIHLFWECEYTQNF